MNKVNLCASLCMRPKPKTDDTWWDPHIKKIVYIQDHVQAICINWVMFVLPFQIKPSSNFILYWLIPKGLVSIATHIVHWLWNEGWGRGGDGIGGWSYREMERFERLLYILTTFGHVILILNFHHGGFTLLSSWTPHAIKTNILFT